MNGFGGDQVILPQNIITQRLKLKESCINFINSTKKRISCSILSKHPIITINYYIRLNQILNEGLNIAMIKINQLNVNSKDFLQIKNIIYSNTENIRLTIYNEEQKFLCNNTKDFTSILISCLILNNNIEENYEIIDRHLQIIDKKLFDNTRRIIIKKHLYIKNPDQQNKDINKLNLLYNYWLVRKDKCRVVFRTKL